MDLSIEISQEYLSFWKFVNINNELVNLLLHKVSLHMKILRFFFKVSIFFIDKIDIFVVRIRTELI